MLCSVQCTCMNRIVVFTWPKWLCSESSALALPLAFSETRVNKINNKWNVSYFMTIQEPMSKDEYFFEGLNILISTFCVYTDGFQGFSKAFFFQRPSATQPLPTILVTV
jgi:hypothetical protein